MIGLTDALFGAGALGSSPPVTASYYQAQQQQMLAQSMQDMDRRREEEARRAQLQRDMCEFLAYAIEADAHLKQLFTAWRTARKLES